MARSQAVALAVAAALLLGLLALWTAASARSAAAGGAVQNSHLIVMLPVRDGEPNAG